MGGGPARSFGIADTVTYLSLACAVASLGFSLTGNFFWAALLWCASAIFDNLDGKFASLFDRTAHQRSIGAELDAMVDVAAFGMAPAAGVLAFISAAAPDTLPLAVAICALYVACAVLRLAHFQVRAQAGEHDFVGLPTTEASVFLAATFLLPGLSVPLVLGATAIIALAMIAPIEFGRPPAIMIVLLIVAILAIMAGLFFQGGSL